MPLTVEDGTGIADADSYITRAELIAYAAKRGVTIADDDASDVFAVKAFDRIEAECFKGNPTVDGQATAFPRKIYDADGALLYASDAIPAGIKKAQIEYAVAVATGTVLQPVVGTDADIVREKIGPIETVFEEGTTKLDARVPKADAALRPFLCGQSFGLETVRV